VGQGTVVMAQAGTSGHLRIGKGVFVGARAGILRDVPDGARVFGLPATEEYSWHRSVIALKRLPELLRRVRRLEKSTKGEGVPLAADRDDGGETIRSGGDSGAD